MYFSKLLRAFRPSPRKLVRKKELLHRPARGNFELLEDRRVLSAATVTLDILHDIDTRTASFVTAPNAKFGYGLAMLASGDISSNIDSWFGTTSLIQLNDDAVAIQAIATGDVNDLTDDLTQLGITALSVYQHSVTGYLPFSSIAALAELDSLKLASPIYGGIANVGIANSQGDESQRTDVLRSFQGLTGAGVTVGVISDSYDNGGTGAATTDIGSGDLPGLANPNGFTVPVNVVQDNDLGSDEGRAMLQIVHDIAPEAHLAFANVANTPGIKTQMGMADNIRSLAADNNPGDASADVIVDDWIFFAEPFFMDGLVAQAVDEVVGQGVTYSSFAGNWAADSYEVASFTNSGQTLSVNIGGGQVIQDTLHDFDQGAGVDAWQTVVIPPGTTTFSFQWDDPFLSVAPGGTGAARNFNVWVRDFGQTTSLRAGGFASTLGGDPVEVTQVTNNTGANQTIEVALGFNGALAGFNQNARLKYVMFSPGAAGTINQFATNSSTLFGHANAAGAIAVGASAWYNTPEFDPAAPYTAPALNNFSALGGTQIIFDTDGNRLAVPEIRDGVDLVGPDGVNTTFFGSDIAQDVDALPNFFGTSAAAPHIAGLAALLLQANPSLTPAGIENVLKDSAIDMDNPYTVGFDTGIDAATGAGFVDALGAIGLVQNTPQLVGLDPNEYILVNVTNDALDTNPDPNIIDVSAAAGNQVSLRAAIVNANIAIETEKTILVPASTYNLTLPGTGGTTQGDLDITGNVTLVGAGAGATVINAGGASGINDRIFEVAGAGRSLNASRMTMTGGNVVAPQGQPPSLGGGAIFVDAAAAVTLNQVAIVGNNTDQVGGGIRVRGNGTQLTVQNSVISSNTSIWVGGGITVGTETASVITIGSTVFAKNVSTMTSNENVYSDSPITNQGNNLVDNNTGGYFGATTDFVGSVNYVVTSLVDSFDANRTTDVVERSLREAIDLANASDNTLQAIWLPAWNFVLTRQRTGGVGTTDTDTGFGDLDIKDSLSVRGVGSGLTSVRWRPGISDAVFDLLGDYNGNGIAGGTVDSGTVNGSDFLKWQQQFSSSGALNQFSADGDDDGDVDNDDLAIWQAHDTNSLALLGLEVVLS